MDRSHIMIVEGDALLADMFHLWMLHAPGVGRVSVIADWEGWWDVGEGVSGVFMRSEAIPADGELPGEFLRRNPVRPVVVLGRTCELKVPGFGVTVLPTTSHRKDVWHALGLNLQASSPAGRREEKKLTAKETAVVCMTVKGYSMKEIADELECTVSTIQSYKRRAMEKLCVEHLADLSVAAAARGLRDCPCRKINSFK